MANLAAALSPLLSLGQAAPAQQQQRQAITGDSLLAGLMAPPPRTQAQQMRTSIGGMFGIDTRPATEKLAEQLASKPLTTAADYTNAAQVAKNLGLSAQAIQLNTLATEKQKEEEQTRIKTEATVAQRAASAQRVVAAMQNTSDPRVQRELQSLIPSIGAGVLSGSELNTAIDEAFSRSEIKPMTAAQRTSYDNLITEDPELMKLIEEPSFLSRLFGKDTTPETGREALISELHILQQQNPNIPLGQLADVFLESIGPQVLEVQSEGTDAPSETVESEAVLPYRSTEDIKESAAKTEEAKKDAIKQVQDDINSLLDQNGYPKGSRERAQEFSRLYRIMLKNRGIEVPVSQPISDLSTIPMPEDMSGYGPEQKAITRRNLDKARSEAFRRRYARLLSTSPQTL